jgi:hypothetical protein
MGGEQGAVISGLFVTMRNDAELAALLRPLLIPAVPPVRAVCERAERRGELALGQDVRFIDHAHTMKVIIVGARLRSASWPTRT